MTTVRSAAAAAATASAISVCSSAEGVMPSRSVTGPWRAAAGRNSTETEASSASARVTSPRISPGRVMVSTGSAGTQVAPGLGHQAL
jgi:hypothetical protein